MDIRSLIDSDTSTAPQPHSIGKKQSDARQGYQQPQQTFHGPFDAQSAYNGSRETRPAQPPPLQPPNYSDSRSPSVSSYHSVHSPYQHTPSSTLSGGQYPFPQHMSQSPAHGLQASPYAQREPHASSTATSHQPYGATTPIVLTPLAINPSSSHTYSHHPRQTSSHSTSTPTSAQNHIPNFFKESPQGSQSQIRASSQSHSNQYISQPGTPLGPPPTIGRPLSNLHRESPGSYEHQRSHSGGSYSYQQALASSPRTDLPGSSTASPLGDEFRRAQPNNPGVSGIRERERSLSVSPKTRIPNQLQMPISHVISGNDTQPQPSHAISDNISQVQLSRGNSDNAIQEENASWGVKLTPNKRKTGVENPADHLAFSQNRQKHGSIRAHAASETHNLDETVKVSKETQQIGRHDYGTSPTSIKVDHKPSTVNNFSEPVQISESLPGNQQLPKGHPGAYQKSLLSTFPYQQPSPAAHQPQQSPHQQAPFPSQQYSLSHQQHSPSSHQPQSSSHQYPPPTTHQQHLLASHKDPSSSSSSSSRPLPLPSSSQQLAPVPHLVSASNEISNQAMTSTIPQPPSLAQNTGTQPSISSLSNSRARKKRRPLSEIPIYAQSIRTPSKSLFPKSGHNVPKPAQHMQQESKTASAYTAQNPSRFAVSPMGKGEAKQQANGHPPQNNVQPLQKAEPLLTDIGPLGPWEPSITNVIPSEDVTRVISNFLFTEVVSRDDVGTAPIGVGTSKGAVLEVEAKIGQLIDKNTNDRLRLPVMTECVISANDPNLRLAFKSSMTEAQHRSLNEFLNKALVNSQTPKPNPTAPKSTLRPRAPMSYVHTYESDSFLELSQTGTLSLPGSIRAQLNPRNTKAKVRITTDQKTGKEIARIVKARVADIDIHSPRTAFDWRISVNVEMNFDGDLKTMTLPSVDGKRSDRNKDRMSYRHQAYQIDLTQVTPTEAISKTEKEHELEIEVSTAEIRKQGLLARDGLANDYETLIRGFVDNVRLLARHCQ